MDQKKQMNIFKHMLSRLEKLFFLHSYSAHYFRKQSTGIQVPSIIITNYNNFFSIIYNKSTWLNNNFLQSVQPCIATRVAHMDAVPQWERLGCVLVKVSKAGGRLSPNKLIQPYRICACHFRVLHSIGAAYRGGGGSFPALAAYIKRKQERR